MTKNERLQQIWHLYESEHGHSPSTMSDVVDWAVSQSLLQEPPQLSGKEQLSRQMSAAVREEYDTHNGRRYRLNHAVRIVQDGTQRTFWGMMGYASHDHMEKAFAQRREHIIHECVQLNTDVLVYNDLNKGLRPEIQMVLDFTDDVAERDSKP